VKLVSLVKKLKLSVIITLYTPGNKLKISFDVELKELVPVQV
jgi:hypothetical protein